MKSREGDRGKLTISPPAKVKIDAVDGVRVLASGLDTLVLAIDVKWRSDDLFYYLAHLKDEAKEKGKELPGLLGSEEECSEWLFSMRPHGARGYEWLLTGGEFTLRIGNWMEPQSMPSIMAEIRSEALWHQGPEGAVDRILRLLDRSGASVTSVKPSRVDLCLDITFPEELWSKELASYQVTRAIDTALHLRRPNLTGINVGRGGISARIYDKPLEIRQRASKKEWMFDIWRLKEVPEGYRIIRIEFQLRREVLKELGIDTIDDLFEYGANAWRYCTENWLKFQDRPGKHHTQRSTVPWWQLVQNGFFGIQGADPLIRDRAIRADMKQLRDQIIGLASSVTALHMEKTGYRILHRAKPINCFAAVRSAIAWEEVDFGARVHAKRVKYHRARLKSREARERRLSLEFPSGGSKINAD